MYGISRLLKRRNLDWCVLGAASEPEHPDRHAKKHRETSRHQAEMNRAENMEYIAYVHKDRKSDYGVSFPDFPGCITAGKTLEEASRMAAEALTFHIQGMIEDGETVPEPSPIDDVAADAARLGAIAFLVNVDAPDATVRVNITARESQLAKIDALAEAAGLTRSGYMVRAAIGAGVGEKKRPSSRSGRRPGASMRRSSLRARGPAARS